MLSSKLRWFTDLHKRHCVTSSDVSRPAKSSDFGSEGYTASLTDWHELLQLTAPDDTCGLVIVRGNFPNSAEGILSRAQRRDNTGHKGTFGIRIQRPDPPKTDLPDAQTDTDVYLGARKAHGWVNLRWPYSLYELRRMDGVFDRNTGTYEEMSFVKDDTIFHIARIRWGDSSAAEAERSRVTIQIKGVTNVRFACPCSMKEELDNDVADDITANETPNGVDLISDTYKKRLEIRWYTDQGPLDLFHSTADAKSRSVSDADSPSATRLSIPFGKDVYIVSTYALRSDDSQSTSSLDLLSDTPSLTDYLGVSITSHHMSDRLWTALCSSNYDTAEGVEICVVGRGVEQILGVASIPVLIHKQDKWKEIVLIDNIMKPQFINVQSAFFQVRLLIKAYNFIKTRRLSSDKLNEGDFASIEDIRKAYLERLKTCIVMCLTWLTMTEMSGELLLAMHSSKTKSSADKNQSPMSARLQRCKINRELARPKYSYNQACYGTLTIWYVMRHCPDIITPEWNAEVLLPKIFRSFKSVDDRTVGDTEPTPKNDTLEWLHYSAAYLMCDTTYLANQEGQGGIKGFTRTEVGQSKALEVQQLSEKYASRLKPTYNDYYSAEHEELDRVNLVSVEMGLEQMPTSSTASLAEARLSHTRARIMQRRRTTRFNPGPQQRKGGHVISNGPWELQAINHETALRLAADELQVRDARDRLFQYVMSDYTFMISWDRADYDMVEKWWNLEPLSIIGATLLDLKSKGKLRAAASNKVNDDDLVLDIGMPVNLEGNKRDDQRVHIEPANVSAREILESLQQIRRMLGQDGMPMGAIVKNFDWVALSPGLQHLPNWRFQSLEDTPEQYRVNLAQKLPLRKAIRNHLDRHQQAERPISNASNSAAKEYMYTTDTIWNKISALDVTCLSLFDLRLTNDWTFDVTDLSITAEDHDNVDPILTHASTGLSRMINPGFQAITRPSPIQYDVQQIETHRKALFKRLNDSLVDLGVKHRILFVEQSSPPLVKAFIYLWHPAALDTFDSHFGATSSLFIETREALSWTTSMTFSHWVLRPNEPAEAASRKFHGYFDSFHDAKRSKDFPPENITKLGNIKKKAYGSKVPYKLEEKCSSIVITGDQFGHAWICSIWSSINKSTAVASSVDQIREVLHRFIHLQASGRSLAFLVLLGDLCEKLAGEYANIIEELDAVMKVNDEVLLEGFEWETDEDISRLKKMFWGLEALRIIEDRLSSSLLQVRKAREAMDRNVKLEAGEQHIDLLLEYDEVTERFEKRYGMLSAMQNKTQLRIRRVMGLREGLSTVTNIEDSRTTIGQGNNIRTLTYITILYLPLTFVTSLFAISHANFMDNANDTTFAIALSLSFIGTIILAVTLEQLMKLIKEPITLVSHSVSDAMGTRKEKILRKPVSLSNDIEARHEGPMEYK